MLCREAGPGFMAAMTREGSGESAGAGRAAAGADASLVEQEEERFRFEPGEVDVRRVGHALRSVAIKFPFRGDFYEEHCLRVIMWLT
jgi:hypothetical protein